MKNAIKPTPKVECAVSNTTGNTLKITPATRDAVGWIEKNLPEYGQLCSYVTMSHYLLHVSDLYSASEVMMFIKDTFES